MHKIVFALIVGIGSLLHAAPVRIQNPVAISGMDLAFRDNLRRQGFTLPLGQHIHWIEDVQVTDKGSIEHIESGSLLVGTDAMGLPVEIECQARFTVSQRKVIFDPRLPHNPSCIVNGSPTPRSDLEFATQEWYPHSGLVDRKTFQVLYTAFDSFLGRRGYHSPSWTRDSWILRVAPDSQLQIQRLWIFASALIDRESLNIEKRADCHGEIHRLPTEERRDENLNEVWSVYPTYTCRIQLYRFSKICYGPAADDCEFEWAPCDGAACIDSQPSF